MKRTELKKLHEMTTVELEVELQKDLKALTQARLEKVAGRLKDVASVERLADNVARVRAIIGEKTL